MTQLKRQHNGGTSLDSTIPDPKAGGGEPPDHTLYLVATPIGNLEDITLRALRVLRSVHLILAEDTRRTSILLRHYDIATRLLSYNEHNQARRANQVIAALAEGDVALVSDAGTPLVSDPGLAAARLALDCGVRLESIPGASAPLAALSVSCLPTDRFYFGGFLPRRSSDRRQALAAVAPLAATLIFFESPHRLRETANDLLAILGDRSAAFCTELTKLFEECRRAPLSGLIAALVDDTYLRGEWTLVIGPPDGETRPASADKVIDVMTDIEDRIGRGASVAVAVRSVAHDHHLPRRMVYATWLAAHSDDQQEG